MASALDVQLFEALAALRAERDPARRARHGAWRSVRAFVVGDLGFRASDDARQIGLVRVFKHLDALDAVTPTSAAAWVRKIVRNRALDEVRGAQRDPSDREGALSGGLDGLPGATGGLDDEALRRALTDELEEAIVRVVASQEPRPVRAATLRLQARARLHRKVLGKSLPDVRIALGAAGRVSDDVLAQWVRRGRDVLSAAVEAWAEEGDATEFPDSVLARVRAYAAEERADAGVARPARRAVRGGPASDARRMRRGSSRTRASVGTRRARPWGERSWNRGRR